MQVDVPVTSLAGPRDRAVTGLSPFGAGRPMRIVLIHPQHAIQRHGTGVYKKHLRYAPITMPTLAALVPPELGAELRVFDEMVEEVQLDAPADLVGLTAISSASTRAYELAKHFRARGAVVVLGGVHATLMTDEALEHVDVVVRGYAEHTWPQVLRDFRDGTLRRVYEPPSGLGAEIVVAPARQYIRRSEYVANNTVEMSRGCNKRCDFCVTHLLNPAYVTRDVGEVIDEIRRMPGKLVTFLDPNVIGNIPYAREFFTAMKKLRKYWVGCVSIDVMLHPELLDLMVDSGAKGFLIGFESLNQQALDSVNKAFSRVEDYQHAIATFHRKGVMVQGSFVLGFDTDELDVFEKTVEFVIKARIDLPQFTVFTPFPGTPLFHRLAEEGRILTCDWSRYNGHEVVFQPKNMTPQQLDDGVRWTWGRVYSLGAILRRLLAPPLLLKPVALLSNLNFRRFMRRVHFGIG
jgi:radical SAM superfamily enzyme YgiQ (UPF0313 family)